MIDVLGQYKNGNYDVIIFSDGTKIRKNDLDSFEPEYPESMDIKITNSCDRMCSFCHEASVPNGVHGDILNLPFLDSLMPYTELAIGGGNPLSHPDLVPFLQQLKERNLIPNMTVHQYHFIRNKTLLRELTEQGFLYGLGVSYNPGTGDLDIDEFINAIKEFPNAVVHVINGVCSPEDLSKLSGHGLKILILGYKDFRRGVEFHSDNKIHVEANLKSMKERLSTIVSEQWFRVVSFDNLAIRQLDVRSLMSEEEWSQFYMGDDGGFTMYVDAVSGEYAVCSVSDVRHKITDSIREMFAIVQFERNFEYIKR